MISTPWHASVRTVIAISLISGMALGACSKRPGPEVLRPAVATEGGTTTVFVATNRVPLKSDPHGFGANRSAALSFLRYDVNVPKTHVPGSIEWPGRSNDPEKSFTVKDRADLDSADFMAALTAGAGKKSVLVFVHGYNTSFQQALFRQVQLATDSQFSDHAILFSWPSNASVTGYAADREAATYSRDHLASLLEMLAKDPDIGEVTLIGHSMGAWLTMEALRQLRQSGKGAVISRLTVVLAAPDIDIDVFQAQVGVIGRLDPHMTVLVANDDDALMVSRHLNGGRDRLGSLDVTDPRIQSAAINSHVTLVDITNLEKPDGSNHSRFATMAALYPTLHEKQDVGPTQAGAFLFRAIGYTLASPFILLGNAVSPR